MKKYYWLLVLFLLPMLGKAWQLLGTVTDSAGAPLPYVSVYLQNSTYGVVTNLKGQYFIELENGNHTIVFQAVGYQKQAQKITVANKNKRLNVVLNPSVTNLKEVEVQAEGKDPAYAIIKKAIENRKKFQEPAKSFSCNAYIKATLKKEFFTHDTMSRKERDTMPNEFTTQSLDYYESYATLNYQAPNNWKEVKYGVKDFNKKGAATVEVSFSPDENAYYDPYWVNKQLFKLEATESHFNFYENTLHLPNIGQVPFLSPIASTALVSYKYKLEETFLENGIWINKIQVIPRRKAAALFSGYIYITDKIWNVKAVDLQPDKKELLHFNYFRILQEYSLVNDSAWLLSREEFFYNTKDGKAQLLGNTILHYNDYELGKEFGKNYFKNEVRATVDDAYERDTIYWKNVRPITLTEAELDFVEEQDSIRTYRKSDAYLSELDSSINHLSIWDFFFNGVGFRNSFKKRSIYFWSILDQLKPWGVGGYRHDFGFTYTKSFSKEHRVVFSPWVDYGFKNKDIKGGVEASLLYLPKRFGRLHGEYRNDYEMLNQYESVQAILARGNYISERFYSFGHEIEIFNGLYADVSLEYGQKRPIDNLELAEWTEELFGQYNEPVEFTPFNELVADVKLKYTFKQKYITEPHRKIVLPNEMPTIQLWYKKGIPGPLSSSADYDFLEFSGKQELTVGTFGASKIRFWLGSYLTSDSLQIPDYRYFRRSDPYWFSNPTLSFQLLRPGANHIRTKQPYFQVNYVHNFNGVLLNKIPLLKKIGLQAAAGTGLLYIQDVNFRHNEAFAGVEWPFRIKKQRIKVGCYYTVANSNVSRLDGEFKFGIDFFNSWTNKWGY